MDVIVGCDPTNLSDLLDRLLKHHSGYGEV